MKADVQSGFIPYPYFSLPPPAKTHRVGPSIFVLYKQNAKISNYAGVYITFSVPVFFIVEFSGTKSVETVVRAILSTR